MSELKLRVTKHPNRDDAARFDRLVGIDHHKRDLLDELALILDPDGFRSWQKKFHPEGLPFLDASKGAPLVLLSGEVGCGKTALAQSVGSPLAKRLDKPVVTLETPSDIRGGGHVGEVSARITDAFAQARARAKEVGAALLIVDEADDLATSRAQMQAHHEDRAGLNVLIKQIDAVQHEGAPLAVVLITNRANALDPAVIRRARLHLEFTRPDAQARGVLFEALLRGVGHSPADIKTLVKASEREVPFSFSDLTDRVGRNSLRTAWREKRELDVATILATLQATKPSPLIIDNGVTA